MAKSYYSGTIAQFLEDNETGNFIPKMKSGGGLDSNTDTAEVRSWQNNAKALAALISKLPEDVHIAFEYQAPVGGRIDVMLFGKDAHDVNNVVVIELKQWDNSAEVSTFNKRLLEVFTGGYTQEVAHPSAQVEGYCNHIKNYIDLFSNNDFNLQGIAYCYNYSSDEEQQSLFAEQFNTYLEECPIFTRDTKPELAQFLYSKLSKGHGKEIYDQVTNAPEFPTPELLNAASRMVIENDNNTFILLGEQSVAYETFEGMLEKALKNSEEKKKTDEKHVLVVKGGPGTGKTILALKILAEQAAKGHSVFYTTRSTALKNQLVEALNDGNLSDNRKASDLIRGIFDFKPNFYNENQIDVLIVDEAHLVHKLANHFTDRDLIGVDEKIKSAWCPLSQTLALMYCAKVIIFLIDDLQGIKSDQIGNSLDILNSAKNYRELILEQREKGRELVTRNINTLRNGRAGLEKKILERKKFLETADMASRNFATDLQTLDSQILLKRKELAKEELKLETSFDVINPMVQSINVNVRSVELNTQFRCNGADRYIKWLDGVLYSGGSKDIIEKLPKDEYAFEVMDDPRELVRKIKSLGNELTETDPQKIVRARLLAGWCWEWKQQSAPNGDIPDEIELPCPDGTVLRLKWETNNNVRGVFRKHYPKNAQTFATDPRGCRQVGCIHSGQGFEFDYVGVILGPDIDYDKSQEALVTHKELNKDGGVNSTNNEKGDEEIRNIYRVLMTRGKKGCFVYCCNPGVANFLKAHMEQ